MDDELQRREEKLKKFGFEITQFRSVWTITSIDGTDIPKEQDSLPKKKRSNQNRLMCFFERLAFSKGTSGWVTGGCDGAVANKMPARRKEL